MRIAWPQILVILLIVLLLFGASRLPDLARNLGKSMRVMKDEIKDLRDDDDPKPDASGGTASVRSQSAPDSTATNSAPYQPPAGQSPTGYEVPRDGHGTAPRSGSAPDERHAS